MGRTKCVESSLVLRGSGKSGGARGSKDARGAQHIQQSKTGFDGRAEAPMRKTATAFRQPVTLVHTTSRRSQKAPDKQQANSATKSESGDRAEKGRQAFWAKSLEGIRAMVPLRLADKFSAEDDLNIEQRMELPQKIETMVPTMSEGAATATFCSSLHTAEQNGFEVVGQQATRKQIEENPFEALKFAQPFVQIPTITDQDILAQERRVLDARRRLQELRKSFMIK